MSATEVILVNRSDTEIGRAEKLIAHRLALRHRAFSIFIIRQIPQTNQFEILLQQRAEKKYHSGGLWSNSCCGHPRPGNFPIELEANRRLKEELGFSVPIGEFATFSYLHRFQNGLTEYEIVHLFLGKNNNNKIIHPNPEEVNKTRWERPEKIRNELFGDDKKSFTPWFQEAFRIFETNVAKFLLTNENQK